MKVFVLFVVFLFFWGCGSGDANHENQNPNENPKQEEKIVIPDDLSEIASPLVKNGDFSDNISFLYKGEDKIQGDIKDGAINDEIVSVITGNNDYDTL